MARSMMTPSAVLEDLLQKVNVQSVTVDQPNSIVVKFNMADPVHQRQRKALTTTPASEVYKETKKVVLDGQVTVVRVGIKQEFSFPAEWYYHVVESDTFFKAPTVDAVLAYEFWIKNRDIINCNLTPSVQKRFQTEHKGDKGEEKKESRKRSGLFDVPFTSKKIMFGPHQVSDQPLFVSKELF